MTQKRAHGFTIVELIFAIIILGLAATFFFIQKNQITIAASDDHRKTAINAMFYSLEEVYYKQHSAYPRTVDETVLLSVDPELFYDPNGVKIGEAESDYRYEAAECNADGTCKSYTLRSVLENEDDYVKQSRNR